MAITLVLVKLKQEDHRFQTSTVYTARFHLTNKYKTSKAKQNPKISLQLTLKTLWKRRCADGGEHVLAVRPCAGCSTLTCVFSVWLWSIWE